MDNKDIEIGVIGAGAIGGVMGTLLNHSGYSVEISKRLDSEFVVIDNTVCMEITGKFGNISSLVPYVKDNNFSTKKDVIFLCVSAYNLDWCMQKALSQLKPDGVIVALQNVWSVDELIRTIPKNKLFLVYNDWNSVRLSGKEMFVYDSGDIHLGAITNNLDRPITFVKDILSCISNVVIEKDFISFLTSRFLLDNALITLGAISGKTLGEILKDKQGKKIFLNVISEEVQAMQTNGFEVEPCYGVFDYKKFVEKSVSGLFYRAKMFSRLINKNGQVVSRLLRRLENNKKTEVDYYMSKICMYANKKDIKVPYCEVIDKMLREIVNKERTICMENIYDDCFMNIR